MKRRFKVDVRTRCEVLRIDREKRIIVVRDCANDREYAEEYDVLILSPGAEPIRPKFPRAGARRVFTLRSMAGTIPGAVNIPVDDVRDHLHELPRDKELLIFCRVGIRGYLPCRILAQARFECRNLTGGYKTYCAARAIRPNAAAPAAELRNDTGEKDS
jgi:hypothetical protein